MFISAEMHAPTQCIAVHLKPVFGSLNPRVSSSPVAHLRGTCQADELIIRAVSHALAILKSTAHSHQGRLGLSRNRSLK